MLIGKFFCPDQVDFIEQKYERQYIPESWSAGICFNTESKAFINSLKPKKNYKQITIL